MDDALLESGARVVSRGATAARKLAAEIVPMWNNDSAANTMEFTSGIMRRNTSFTGLAGWL